MHDFSLYFCIALYFAFLQLPIFHKFSLTVRDVNDNKIIENSNLRNENSQSCNFYHYKKKQLMDIVANI